MEEEARARAPKAKFRETKISLLMQYALLYCTMQWVKKDEVDYLLFTLHVNCQFDRWIEWAFRRLLPAAPFFLHRLLVTPLTY